MTYKAHSSIMITDLKKNVLLCVPIMCNRCYTVSNVKFLIFSLTVFICSFMVAAPIFGYLGDRFNRKVILSCGIFFWSAVTLLSSFITKEVRGLLHMIVKIRLSSHSIALYQKFEQEKVTLTCSAALQLFINCFQAHQRLSLR